MIQWLATAAWPVKALVFGATGLVAASATVGAIAVMSSGGDDASDASQAVTTRGVTASTPKPTAPPRNSAADAEQVVRKFYERFAKFDTAGMVDLSCPESVDDIETAVSLLQGVFGFGAFVAGVDAPSMTLEDFAVETVSVSDDEVVVSAAGRLNAGAPYGSTDIDELVTVRRIGSDWCLAGDEDAIEEPNGNTSTSGQAGWKAYVMDVLRAPLVLENSGYERQAKTGWDFLVVTLAFENGGVIPAKFGGDILSTYGGTTAVSSTGYVYELAEGSRYWFDATGTSLAVLPSGWRQTVALIFEVPLNQDGFTLTLPEIGQLSLADRSGPPLPTDLDGLPRPPLDLPDQGWSLSIGPDLISTTQLTHPDGGWGCHSGGDQYRIVGIPATVANHGGYDLQTQFGFLAVDTSGLVYHTYGVCLGINSFGGNATPGGSAGGYVYFLFPQSLRRVGLIITNADQVIGTLAVNLP